MITFLYKPKVSEELNNLFEVSREFEAEFEELTGYGVDDPQAGNLRVHPVAAEIFQRRGAAWSGPGLASVVIPERLVPYVRVLAFKDGERLYYDYNKMVFDKVALMGAGSMMAFLSELRALMRLFPNTVCIESGLMKRIEIGDYLSEQYMYKPDFYVECMLRAG